MIATEIEEEETALEREWRWAGRKFITPLYAIGSSTATTVAVGGVAFIAGLALPALIPILAAVFIAEAAINIYIYKDALPETFVSLFVKDFFLPLKRETPFSAKEKIVLGAGLGCAVIGGVGWGAFTGFSIFKASLAIMALIGFSFPPVGIILGAFLGIVAFVAFSGLLTKWIKSAIENNILMQMVNFFKALFTRTDKPLGQELLEKGFKSLFVLAILALTVVGTIATLGTVQAHVNTVFTLLIQGADKYATFIASSAITFGFMCVARLPFVVHHACKFFARIGEAVGRFIFKIGAVVAEEFFGYKPVPVAAPPAEEKPSSKWGTAAKVGALLVFSFSHGALAQSEGGAKISGLLEKMDTPLSPETRDILGEQASIGSGGLMATGIGGYTLLPSATTPASHQNTPVIATTTLKAGMWPGPQPITPIKTDDPELEREPGAPSPIPTIRG